ncbi:MAG: mobile mystery protein B [Planctomycetia bacterium]|jgi:Fic-DOC domain mobile mystery protein B
MAADGETPLTDFDGLRNRRIRTRSQLAVAEAENIRRAVIRYLVAVPSRKSATFNFGWMLGLHTEMFGDVWSWAGQIRTRPLSLGSDPAHIGEHLAQLCDDIRGREPYMPSMLEQAVLIHHRAVQIHPFRNGNGRWSRMLSNIWLRIHQCPIVEWPAGIGLESPIRSEYLACLRAADAHDMAPLLELHARHQPPPRP